MLRLVFLFAVALLWITFAEGRTGREMEGVDDPTWPLVIENAIVIPVNGSGTYYDPGWIAIDADGRIAAIGPSKPPRDTAAGRTIDASGRIIIPGFLSGHSHLYQSAFRGIGAHYTLHGWIACYHMTYGPFYDDTDLYWLSKHGAMDYLAHGVTTIYDWTLNNGWSVDTYTDLYRGSLDSGARILFGYGLSLGQSLEENRAMLKEYLEIIEDEGIDASHPRVPGVWMAGLGLLNGREIAMMEFTLAKEFDLPMQVHYLEEPRPDYVQIQQELFEIYEETDILGPKFNFAHFINTTDPILKRTGETKTGMIWNPLSNGRLASGLADIPYYRQFDFPIGMGIDGQASADVSDPFENMRMGLYAIRIKYQKGDSLMPLEVLRMHTIGTAEVLGIDDEVGSLEPGKWADFVIIDPRNLETSPPIHPVEHVVLACSVANVESVWVGGEMVVERGVYQKTDWEEVKHEIDWRLKRIQERLAHARATGKFQYTNFSAGLEGFEHEEFHPEHEHPLYGKPHWHELDANPFPTDRSVPDEAAEPAAP